MHRDPAEWQMVGGIYGFLALRKSLDSLEIYIGYMLKPQRHTEANNYEKLSV